MFTYLKIDFLTFNLIFFSYLIGSISNAILLSYRLKLPDPRTMGSNNPGSTNMLRIGGKKVAAIVFILDLLKGLIPIYFVKWLNMQDLVVATVAIAVFIGHLFPIFFKFQGGKGVATTLGIMLAICWKLALFVLISWILMFVLFKISSLSSLTASCLTIILCGFNLCLINKPFEISKELNNCIIILSILIILKHKENIKKLLTNTENLLM